MDMRLLDRRTGRTVVIHDRKRAYKIFNCGPTVCELIHVGHARNALLPDVLKSVLHELGIEEVCYLSNVSNISNKIYERSKREPPRSWRDIGDHFTRQWMLDLLACNIAVPDVIVPDTMHVHSIIRFVEELLGGGVAYERNGSVYYRIADLAGVAEAVLADGACGTEGLGAEIAAADRDFVLWEAVGDRDEMIWESPWGRGRPGNHIPCSDVIASYCGKDDFIVHCAGNDLYSHHACEFAQTASVSRGDRVAKAWVYNAMVHVNGQKMSKSLGNGATVREALNVSGPDGLRWYLLTHDFDQVLAYDPAALANAGRKWLAIRSRVDRFRERRSRAADRKLYAKVMGLLTDNLRTREALSVIQDELSTAMNDEGLLTVRHLLGVLGFRLA